MARDDSRVKEGVASLDGEIETGKDSTYEEEGCPCRYKETPRGKEMQADLQKRLNRVIGQLGGVKTMLEDNRYCGDVLVQLAAAESAVRSISGKLLQNHLETCVVEQIQRGNIEVVDEVMQLMRKFSR